jgi:predicted HicB family RNase H-like nuclease
MSESRSKRLLLSLTPQEHARIKAVAERRGISMNELIRGVVMRAIDARKGAEHVREF